MNKKVNSKTKKNIFRKNKRRYNKKTKKMTGIDTVINVQNLVYT